MTEITHRLQDLSEPRGRARVLVADLATEQGSRTTVHVVLERDGQEYAAEVSGVGEETLLLRLAAQATLDALSRMVGESNRFVLVGIKRIIAFDASVVLACIRPADDPMQRLIGCVPEPENLVHGVVTAVLHATNRIVEALPEDPSEVVEAGATEASSAPAAGS